MDGRPLDAQAGKTRIAAAILLAAAIALVAIGARQALKALGEVTASVQTVVNDRLAPLVQLRAVGDQYVREVYFAVQGVQQGKQDPAAARERLQLAREAAGRQWGAYLQTYLVPDELRIVQQASPLLARADETTRQFEALLVRGDTAALEHASDEALHSVFGPLTASVDRLIDLQQHVAAAEVERSLQAQRWATASALGAAAAALACASALAWLLLRQERRRRHLEGRMLRRQSDLYAALSRTNQSIVHLRDEQALSEELVRTCVETGHALYAVLLMKADGQPRRVAIAGPASGLRPDEHEMIEQACAPGTPVDAALQRNQVSFLPQLAGAAGSAPPPGWQARALALGVRGMAALPICVDGQPEGCLAVFVAEHDALDSRVRELLGEMAGDIGFAVQSLRLDEERRRAQAEVEAAARRFLRVFNALPLEAVLVDLEDQTLLEANQRFRERHGLNPEQVPRHPLSAIGLAPEDHMQAVIARLRAGEPVRTLEIEASDAQGRERVLLLNGERIEYRGRDAALVATLDVTERQRDERALREREARLASILESAGDAIVTLDESLNVVVFNREAGRAFGVTATEVMGRPLAERIWPAALVDSRIARMKLLLRLGGHEQIEREVCLRADGSAFTARLAMSTSGAPGQRLVSLVLHDLSGELATEEARAGRAAAEAANQAKNEFLSRMSRELRTPLNAVLGFSQLLLESGDPPLTPGQATKIGAIADAGWHLLALINDVLDVTRIESGQVRLVRAEVVLDHLLDEVCAMLELTAAREGVQLEQAYRQRPPLSIQGDAQRLRQVLVNIVSNAVKYNRPQGRVTLDMARDDGMVVLTVQDSGLGMDARQLTHLYEPFNRLGREKSGIEGTGVGMALTRQLVGLMNGRIAVDSRAGEGTTVRVWLPVRAGDDPPPQPRGAGAAPAPDATPADLPVHGRVLYAEDNPANVLIVQELLARWPQVELRSVNTGARAVALAREWQPDLILLDMTLGDIDGLAVLDALRADRRTAGLCVVGLSANVMPEMVEAARQRGAVDYWTKPIDFRRFEAGMRRLLAQA